jgi:hypothetical protein
MKRCTYGTRYSCLVLWSLACIVLCASCCTQRTRPGPVSTQPPPQNPAQTVLDHFLCYELRPGHFEPPQGRVAILDQFFPNRQPVDVLHRDSLCNPVQKNGMQWLHPEAHLVCYAIALPNGVQPPAVPVTIDNQFGNAQWLTVKDPIKLCLPSGKAVSPLAPPIPPPTVLDHFTCYAVHLDRAVHIPPVQLLDQFHLANSFTANVLDDAFLCAPAEKFFNDEPKGPRSHPQAHLLCYNLEQVKFDPVQRLIHNQFELESIVIVRPRVLCVPSTKRLGHLPPERPGQERPPGD